MEIFILIIIGILLIGSNLFFILRKKDSSMLIQQQIQELARTLDGKIGESSKQMHDSMKTQLGESARIIKEVTEGLTKLDETNKQVVSFADQLQSLQDILKNPKQRGVLGEYYLETVLKNVLPPGQFQMQYRFENGDIVDAVIFLDDDKILPIDSKFSLENYNKILETNDKDEKERLGKLFKQDIKNRIDETAKYIRSKEGTMDFSFMFIPSEGVYYDLLVNNIGSRDLIEYAFQQKKVIIVSPTSFMAYLQTVLQGLRALQIEESAKEIRKHIESMGRHLAKYDDHMLKLGNSLGTTVNHFNTAKKEFGKIDKDIMRITGEGIASEGMVLEKPEEA